MITGKLTEIGDWLTTLGLLFEPVCSLDGIEETQELGMLPIMAPPILCNVVHFSVGFVNNFQ